MSARFDGITNDELCAELLARLRNVPSMEEFARDGELVGRVHASLDRIADHHTNRYSRANGRIILDQLRSCPGWFDEHVAGKVCLELGCGRLNPLGSLLALVALGAERVIGVDLSAIESEDLAARSLYRAAADMIADPATYFSPFLPPLAPLHARLMRCDLGALRRGAAAALAQGPLQFVRASAAATGLPTESVDVSASISFLEHVAEPAAVIAELARVMRPGALGSHRIDGRDHRAYARADLDALSFLEVEPGAALVGGCNRVRPLEFPALFERHGFEVLEVVPLESRAQVDDARRAGFVAPFDRLEREVLEVVDATVHVRRRGG